MAVLQLLTCNIRASVDAVTWCSGHRVSFLWLDTPRSVPLDNGSESRNGFIYVEASEIMLFICTSIVVCRPCVFRALLRVHR